MDELLVRSHRARQAFFDSERPLLRKLVEEGQAPQALFIGCSDSRVVAESLTGSRPGDLFVVRVVGNIVPPYGSDQHGVQAAVDFAIEGLRVPQIVVCGHTECGGMRAVDSPDRTDMPGLAQWLRHARPARDRIEGLGLTGPERHLALVEENVRLQLEHLRSYPAVNRAIEEERLTIHGWVFDLKKLEMYWCDREGRFRLFAPEQAPAPLQ